MKEEECILMLFSSVATGNTNCINHINKNKQSTADGDEMRERNWKKFKNLLSFFRCNRFHPYRIILPTKFIYIPEEFYVKRKTPNLEKRKNLHFFLFTRINIRNDLVYTRTHLIICVWGRDHCRHLRCMIRIIVNKKWLSVQQPHKSHSI